MGSTDTSATDTAVQNLQNASDNNASSSPSPANISPLTGPVGFNAPNAPDDVFQVSSALSANGLMDEPVTDFTPGVGAKIITAQQNMSGLKPDGLVNPGGPTEQRFTELAGAGLMKSPVTAGAERSGTSANKPSLVKGEMPVIQDGSDNARALNAQNAKARVQHRREQSQLRQREEADIRAQKQRLKTAEKLQRQQQEQALVNQKANQQAQQQAITSATRQAVNPPPHSETRGGVPVGAETASPLTAEAFQANQRAARYLGDRTAIGDYPRWVIDAIETGEPEGSGFTPDQAINESADLINQIAARNPDQARRFYDKTIQGINPANRAKLDQALGIWSAPIDGAAKTNLLEPGVLMTGGLKTGVRRTMDYKPDRDGPPPTLKTADHRPDRDGHARLVPLSNADDPGKPEGARPNDPAQGAAEVARPKGHADRIEGAGVGADEHDLRFESGLTSLDAVNASLADGKTMSADDMQRHRARLSAGFRHDEDAKARANALMDAVEGGNTDDVETLQRDLHALANDPARQKAQQESAAYYRATSQAERLANADARGEIRARMEQNVRGALANQAGIAEQNGLIAKHAAAAQAGDPNAKQIVDRARTKRDELTAANNALTDNIAKDAAGYQSIQAHPHPDIDKRGGREQEASENRHRTRREWATDAALIAGTGGTAALGRKGAARAASGAALNTANAASTYSRELSRATARAMAKDGVDFTDKRAAATWVRDNPELSQELTMQALQSAGLEYASGKVGEQAGGVVSNPLGKFATEQGVSEFFPHLINELGNKPTE